MLPACWKTAAHSGICGRISAPSFRCLCSAAGWSLPWTARKRPQPYKNAAAITTSTVFCCRAASAPPTLPPPAPVPFCMKTTSPSNFPKRCSRPPHCCKSTPGRSPCKARRPHRRIFPRRSWRAAPTCAACPSSRWIPPPPRIWTTPFTFAGRARAGSWACTLPMSATMCARIPRWIKRPWRAAPAFITPIRWPPCCPARFPTICAA